jgi:hypothetical protein
MMIDTAQEQSEESSIIRRFIASSTEKSDRLRFTSESIDLWLIAPDTTAGGGDSGGDVSHASRFLADKEYVPVDNVRILRKADDTAFFIIVPAAIPAADFPIDWRLVAGQYRLKMTYRRDNKAYDHDSQVLSEAGNTEPEQVSIDIPWNTVEYVATPVISQTDQAD